jgi:hypothetical protein
LFQLTNLRFTQRIHPCRMGDQDACDLILQFKTDAHKELLQSVNDAGLRLSSC